MTAKALYDFLDARYPRSLSCDWDNDGIMCLPDPEGEIRRVLLTLDVTEDAIRAAEESRAELILSHHPLLFYPLRGLHPLDPAGKKLLRLAAEGIAVFSFHTRLDASATGVGQRLAETLLLNHILPFSVEGLPMGRYGTLPSPLSPDALASLLKKRLDAPEVTYASAGKEIFTLAVLGGSGGDAVEPAIAAGADALVTGDIGYNALLTAAERGLTVFRCGHFETENPVLTEFAEAVRRFDPTIEIEAFGSRTAVTV